MLLHGLFQFVIWRRRIHKCLKEYLPVVLRREPVIVFFHNSFCFFRNSANYKIGKRAETAYLKGLLKKVLLLAGNAQIKSSYVLGCHINSFIYSNNGKMLYKFNFLWKNAVQEYLRRRFTTIVLFSKNASVCNYGLPSAFLLKSLVRIRTLFFINVNKIR